MNKNQYRLVFSRKLDMLVAVAEITSAQGKAIGSAALTGIGLGGGLLGLSLAVSNVFAQTSLLSTNVLPTAPTTTVGVATYVTSGKTLTVTQSTQNLGTNWQSFSIGQGNAVIFKQPNASSISVNRVIGTDRSEIYGSIQANGQVFLLNPNGVLFGRTAQVDVAGLFATTKTISNADMAAGNFNQLRLIGAAGAGQANVTNLGNISANGANGTGGYVVFAADQILNDGTITAKGGQIIMAAGASLDMSIEEAGSIHVKASEATIQALVDNKGLMVADGGQIILTAKGKDTLLSTVINNSGTLQARSASVKNGVIVLDGGSAGVGGDVMSTGVIDVSGNSVGEKGGVAILTGDRIALTGTASIDASGDAGGGRVIVGGDLLKKATDIMDVKIAGQTVITQGVNISIGSKSGDGGFVETSGHIANIQGNITGAAPNGKAGQWLIDPTNITIVDGSTSSTDSGSFNATYTWSSGSNATSNITNTSIVNALDTTDVLITTNSTGNGYGHLTVSADIAKTNVTAPLTNLTLVSDGLMTVNSNITATTGAQLGINLTSLGDNSYYTGGWVRIASTASICTTSILTINAFAPLANQFSNIGAVMIAGNINATNSLNTITGNSSGGCVSGVVFSGGSQTFNGTITGYSSANGTKPSFGVSIVGGSQTLNGVITGTSANGSGVSFTGGTQTINGTVVGTGGGAYAGANFNGSNLTLNGNITGVSSTNFGVNFSAGNQTINGNVFGTSNTSIGVRFVNGAQVINANVTGNSSTSFGVSFNNGNQTLNGSIIGNSNTGAGVRFNAGNQTLSGNTTVTGSSNQADGIIFIGGTQNITSTAGQGVNITGVTVNSSGASTIHGLNVSNAINITTAGGSVGLYGSANGGSGIFVNANVTSLNTSSIISGRSSTGAGVNFTAGNQTIAGLVSGTSNSSMGIRLASSNFVVASSDLTMNASTSTGSGLTQASGNVTGTGNLSILANQSSTLGNISLSTGSLTANVTGGNLTLNGNLSAGKSITLMAGSQDAAGVVTSGDVIVGTALNVTANTSGTGGTISIYSGTPNTSNANTSAYSGLVSGATSATISKTYNSSVAQTSNASQVLNVLYRIAPNITITAGNNSKVFDANNNTASGNYTVTGLMDGDTVNTSASGGITAYASAAAGTGLTVNVVNTSLAMSNAVVSGYNVNQTISATGGVISKAAVTITTNGTVSSKVFDTTTNAAVLTNSSGTVALGNSTAANGSTSTSNFSAINTSATFVNASAGTQTINLTDALRDTVNYTLVAGANAALAAGAVISKANVTITTNGSVSNKVFDTTTNSAITTNASGTVQLGNAALANGAVNSSTAFTAVNTTSSFINASAGTQTVNLAAALQDTTNYTLVGGSSTLIGTGSAVISKANVTITTNGSVSNKVFDTTTNSAITTNASGTVQLGNAALANGAVNSSTAFTAVNTTSSFINASAGTQTVNLTAALQDTTNYTLVGGSSTKVGTNSAVISKANVTITTNGTVSNKVFDTTVSTAVTSNSSGTVALGNASAANGSTNVSSSFSAINSTATFTNASAGTQTINLTDALRDTVNYTIAGGANTTFASSATISKANVTITTNGSVANKVFDNTTNATITTNASGTVQLGNVALANGSLNASSSFTTLTTSAVFTNASVGTQIVNISATLQDTLNYTIAGSTTRVGINSAVISSAPSPAPSSGTTTNTSSGLSGALTGAGSSSNITSAQADAAVVNLQGQIKNKDDPSYAEDGGAIDFAKGLPRGDAQSPDNTFVPLGGRGGPQKNEPPNN